MSSPSADVGSITVEDLAAHRWAFVSPRYRVVDLDFGIRSDDLPTALFLDRVLAPFVAPGDPAHWYSFVSLGGPESRFSVHLDEVRILTPARQHLVGIYLWRLNQQVMLETTSFLTIHAGVVGIDGRCVVIPGDANAGKSTLVGALVDAGFEYFSDEAALLRLDAPLIAPYLRSLSLEPGSWSLLPSLEPEPDPGYDQRLQWLIPASDLGAVPAPEPCRPVSIVFPKITPGVAAELRPISRPATIRALAKRATNLSVLGDAGFRAIVQATMASTCWELALDGVDDAVAAMHALATKRA